MYLDLDVINNDYKQGGAPPYLRFEEIRHTPFLNGDSSEYLCSIVRFTVQTGNTLPVSIPRIADPMQPNITIYKVSLTYQDPVYSNGQVFIATVPIIYEPEDKTTKVQTDPTGGQDLSGTYYHVHNYTHFINLIN
ncbi:MAG: phage minor capsid protein, partial [Candidatus Fonsibacter sp.]